MGGLKGLKLVRQSGYIAIELNFDSIMVVQMIKAREIGSVIGLTLMLNIQKV